MRTQSWFLFLCAFNQYPEVIYRKSQSEKYPWFVFAWTLQTKIFAGSFLRCKNNSYGQVWGGSSWSGLKLEPFVVQGFFFVLAVSSIMTPKKSGWNMGWKAS
jgi:hypothetical protein